MYENHFMWISQVGDPELAIDQLACCWAVLRQLRKQASDEIAP